MFITMCFGESVDLIYQSQRIALQVESLFLPFDFDTFCTLVLLSRGY